MHKTFISGVPLRRNSQILHFREDNRFKNVHMEHAYLLVSSAADDDDIGFLCAFFWLRNLILSSLSRDALSSEASSTSLNFGRPEGLTRLGSRISYQRLNRPCKVIHISVSVCCLHVCAPYTRKVYASEWMCICVWRVCVIQSLCTYSCKCMHS